MKDAELPGKLYSVDTLCPAYPEMNVVNITKETKKQIKVDNAKAGFDYNTTLSKTFHSHLICRTPKEAWDRAVRKAEEKVEQTLEDFNKAKIRLGKLREAAGKESAE